MASINNAVTIQTLPNPTLAVSDNINIVMAITRQQGTLSTANRYKSYSDLNAVSKDFGSSSDVYEFASVFFSTTPNALGADGKFLIGYWRGFDEQLPATQAILSSGEINDEVGLISTFQRITEGRFSIEIDGFAFDITGIDFSTVTSINQIANQINTALIPLGAGCFYDNNLKKFKVFSGTIGPTSTIGYFFKLPPEVIVTGTYIGDSLRLSSGTGATLVQGSIPINLVIETKLEALIELKIQANMYGAVFIDETSTGEKNAIAEWAQANATLVYDVFSDPANLEVSPTNQVWQIKLANENYFRMLYRKDNNRKLPMGEMSRMHSTNFNAQNSASTIQFKRLAITPEDYDQTEIDKAKTVGMDIYTTIKNTPVVLSSGANDFLDNVYNLTSFKNDVQIAGINLLIGTNTKIPQTIAGVDQIVNTITTVCQKYVRAGVFAGGTWTLPDTFGDKETFFRNIEQFGFYVLGEPLSEQSPTDRNLRKSVPINVAVKLAGAVHSIDIILSFNF